MVPSSPLVRSPLQRNSLSRQFGYELTRPVNLVVLGVDRDPEIAIDSPARFQGRSDTILAVRFDTDGDRLNLLSVPRDTEVSVPGVGARKLNQANVLGGAELAQNSLSGLLNNLPVDRYVRVHTDALVELVDMLGGVEVFVPYPMSYRDRTQQLTIELDAGWQLLNGQQAQQFTRYRQGPYGDIGRVQRQQMLLTALRDRLLNPTVVTRIPAIVRVLQKYVDTNLSIEEMLALAHFGLQLDSEDVRMALLPGRFSTSAESAASYWLVDETQRDRLVRQFFAHPDGGSFLNTGNAQTAIGRPTPANSTDLPRIALQNATTDENAVSQVRRRLAELGYTNVYEVDDWGDVRHQSAIVVQKGDYIAASRLRSALGFGELEARSTGDLDSDLTLRIGRDFTSQRPRQNDAPPTNR